MYTFNEIAERYRWDKRENPRESIRRLESYGRSHGVDLKWVPKTTRPRKYVIMNDPENCFTQSQLIQRYSLKEKSYPNFIKYMEKRGILLEQQEFCHRPYFYKVLDDSNFIQEEWYESTDPKIEITKSGLVRNKENKQIYNITTQDGYKQYRGSDMKLHFVHRLVLETFQPIDDSDSYYVDHIDGKRDNNNIINLRWATPQENIIYKYQNWDILKDNFDLLLQQYGYEKLNEIFEFLIKDGATNFKKF